MGFRWMVAPSPIGNAQIIAFGWCGGVPFYDRGCFMRLSHDKRIHVLKNGILLPPLFFGLKCSLVNDKWFAEMRERNEKCTAYTITPAGIKRRLSPEGAVSTVGWLLLAQKAQSA
jgi:hypothetical protein